MRKLSILILVTFLFVGVSKAQNITYRLVKIFDKSVFSQNERIISYQLNSTGEIVGVETNLSVYKVVAQ